MSMPADIDALKCSYKRSGAIRPLLQSVTILTGQLALFRCTPLR